MEADPGRLSNHRLFFEPNLGQADAETVFIAEADGYVLSLTREEAVFTFDEGALAEGGPHELRMRFVGSDPAAKMQGLDRLSSRSHYYGGADPADWATDVPHYARVIYSDLWPGIDAVFYGNADDRVQYDFIVKPGADPDVVRLAFVGAEPVLEDGSLRLQVGPFSLQQSAPFTYQDLEDRRVPIESAFTLLDSDELGFRIGSFDPSLPLVIDPVVLAYSSYTGGGSSVDGYGITVGGDGSAYFVGTTNTRFSDKSGWLNVLVIKTTPTGELAWRVYLGGLGGQWGYGIAVDAADSAYITGTTYAPNFPTTPDAFQPTLPGNSSAPFSGFVTKFSPDGNDLVYSTYLGGSDGNDRARAIALDGAGSAYVTGSATSTDFPLRDPYQPQLAGGSDAFVTKLTPDGGDLVYSTYLGGSDGSDLGRSIALDANGSAYITGETVATDFPVKNAAQEDLAGYIEGFLTKLHPPGNTIEFSTYLGGSSLDRPKGVAVDGNGNAHVTGFTSSSDFPVHNAYQETWGGQQDVFLLKVSPVGAIDRSTFLGGSVDDVAGGIAVDAGGNATITGYSYSKEFPATGSFVPHRDPVYVARFDSSGLPVESTRLGLGEGRSVALDASGATYVTGTTQATDWPLHLPFHAMKKEHSRVGFMLKLVHHTLEPPADPAAAAGPGRGEITAEWRPPESDHAGSVTSYVVLGKADYLSIPWERLGEIDSTSRTFRHIGLGDGEARAYVVHAVDPVGLSLPSVVVRAETFELPDEPQELIAKPGTGIGQIALEWSPPASTGGTALQGYRIYRSTAAEGPYNLRAAIGNVTQYVDQTDIPQTYYYWVSATNIVGEGPGSEVACSKPYPRFDLRSDLCWIP